MIFCCTQGHKIKPGDLKIGVHTKARPPFNRLSPWYPEWRVFQEFGTHYSPVTSMQVHLNLRYLEDGHWPHLPTPIYGRVRKTVYNAYEPSDIEGYRRRTFIQGYLNQLGYFTEPIASLYLLSKKRDVYVFDLADDPHLDAAPQSFSHAGLLAGMIRKINVLMEEHDRLMARMRMPDAVLQDFNWMCSQMLECISMLCYDGQSLMPDFAEVIAEFEQREGWTKERRKFFRKDRNLRKAQAQ